jgi:ElaB/YqjD/DUF883 family membrane-anchored ribosome-binding protein
MKTSQIKDELKSAKNGVASAAHQLNEDATRITKSAVKDAQQKLDDVACDAMKMTKSAVSDAREKLDDVKSDAEGYLKGLEKNFKAHPGETLLMAFAAGIVFSLLLGRK